MDRPRVFVTRPVFPETIANLSQHFDIDAHTAERPLSKEELIERLQGKHGVLTAGGDRIDG